MALPAAVKVVGLGIATVKAARAAKKFKKTSKAFDKAKEKSQAITNQQKQDRLTNNGKNYSALRKQKRKAVEDLKIAAKNKGTAAKKMNDTAMAQTKAKYKK